MSENASFGSILKHRGFVNLWINQIFVQLAYNSLNFTLIIWVFKLTGSNTAVSLLLFSVYLPAALFGLLAGVFVDISDRKKIIMTVDLLLAIAFASLIFFKDFYLAILAVAFFVNTMAQFYTPAESSSIPLLVKPNQLMVANSLFTITLFSTFLVGFGLAGPLIAVLGVNSAFAAGAIILTLAFICSLFFPTIRTPIDEEGMKLKLALKHRSIQDLAWLTFDEIRRTFRLIRNHLVIIAAICIMAGVQVVIGLMAVLIPAFLERAVQISATDASYVLVIPLGFGMVLGGLFVGKLGHLLPKRRLVGSAIFLAGFLFFLVGIAPIISPAIKYFHTPRPLPFIYQPSLSTILAFGSFVLGACLVSVLIPTQTVLQQRTPEQHRGKVFAAMAVAMSALSLIPVLFVGMLADVVGPLPIFLAMGGSIALIGLFALRPSFFFARKHLSERTRDFLGQGHWE